MLYLIYQRNTVPYFAIFPYRGEMLITGITDSDYSNGINSRQHVSGYMFNLGNSTISWGSQKQKSMCTSSTKAKSVTLSKAAKHILYLKTILTDT
jgi:hypothetical protein